MTAATATRATQVLTQDLDMSQPQTLETWNAYMRHLDLNPDTKAGQAFIERKRSQGRICDAVGTR